MSEAKHTPGPWRPELRKVAGVRWDNVIRSHNNDPVCSVFCAGYLAKEADANASLIAAAPDLLEAAREGLRWIEGWMEARQYPETAQEWCDIHGESVPDAVYMQRDTVRAAIAKATGAS